MPRVYAISDLHGNLPDFPRDADVLLLGGDICPDFMRTRYSSRVVNDNGEQRQRHWLDTEFRVWLNAIWMQSIKVVGIWGNHDFVGEHRFLVPRGLKWTLLEDSEAIVDGIRVYGTPWVPGLPYWAFYGDERKLRLRAEAIPEGIDVLMTHGPPHNAGDFIPTSPKQREKYNNFNGENVGDPTLNDAIRRVQPKTVVTGHIHEDRGSHLLPDGGWKGYVQNVAAVDELYNLHRYPWVRLYEFG
jgi:Icc-related predicted phosphoesterase